MNFLNRMVIVLLLLALGIATIILAAFPEHVSYVVLSFFRGTEITFLDRMMLLLVAAVTNIVCVLLIYAEIRPEQHKTVMLTQVKGGVAELSTESIAGRIRQATETMPDVRKDTPTVIGHGKSVDIRVELLANPGVDVSLKASEVVQAVRDLVEKDIGIKVGKLRVNIKYDAHVVPQIQKA